MSKFLSHYVSFWALCPFDLGFRLVYWSVALLLAFAVSAFFLFSNTSDFLKVVISTYNLTTDITLMSEMTSMNLMMK